MISTNKTSKKAAPKLSKKTSSPGGPSGDFKQDTPRLEVPVPAPVSTTTEPVSNDPNKDSKSSTVPSDAASLPPSIGWAKTPTVLPTNDDDDSDGNVAALHSDPSTAPLPTQSSTLNSKSDGPSLVPTSMLGNDTPTVFFTKVDDDSDEVVRALHSDFPTTPVHSQVPTVHESSKSSDIPSDGPSLVPSDGFETTTDNFTDEEVSDGRVTEGPLNISPAGGRKLGLVVNTPDESPTGAPCLESTNVPTSARSSDSPSTTDSSSMPTGVKCGHSIVAFPPEAEPIGFVVPPIITLIYLFLIFGIAVVASYRKGWSRAMTFRDQTSNVPTPRAHNPRVQRQEQEGREGQFVNN